MSGYETLWVPGIDHAGIATQVHRSPPSRSVGRRGEEPHEGRGQDQTRSRS